jgi:uncharacterized protein (DUF2235 family)
MPTHIVCLDGTGQVKIQPYPTNIARIFDALGGTAVDGGNGSLETATPALSGKYIPGVGTQGNVFLEFLGKAFGDGLAEPIVRGYTFLSRNYAAGDDIVIAGFSRGAAAARALAGFVAGQGLLNPAKYDPTDKDAAYLRAIAAWYAYRSETPQFANQDRLTSVPVPDGGTVPALSAGDFVAVPGIKAVAVFDTVSSLGLPHLDANGDAIYDFAICDTVLSDKVAAGFHALAADEIRDVYAPTYWAKRDGIVQVIFPGAHSDVGGGYPQRGLSDGALEWMLGNLESVGIQVDRAQIVPSIAADTLDIAHDDSISWPYRDIPKRPRMFPESASPHASIAARWGKPTLILPAGSRGLYKPLGAYADGAPIFAPS